jgi:hypothetical protein
VGAVTGFCAAPRHQDQDEPTPAEPHAALCKPCRLALAGDLRRLPALDHELGILSVIAGAAAQADTGILRLPFNADITEWQAWFRRYVTRTTITIALDRKWRLPQDHPWAMCAWLVPLVSRSSLHPGWLAGHPQAGSIADAVHRIRVRGEQLHEPVTVKHIHLPGACLDCGNGCLVAVIYVDSPGGRRAWWECPACETVTDMGPAWWDYPKRLAAMKAAG